MENLLKRALIVSTLIFSTLYAAAQTTVRGKVLDSENGEPMVSSTVMLMTPDTAKMVTGGVTTNDGTYAIKDVKDGQYVVKISYVGYHNFFRAVTVDQKKATPAAKKKEQPSQSVGTTMLVPNSIVLDQAVVTAQLPEVEVKDDTIMFNADAFRVPEGSVLEELVRKLPGVEVDDDGTIKVNGKTVKRILVDGKEFFGNDRQMAMKNLPTEIIDKIKTYDKQSDMARMTGIDDGNEETVMDLTIKKGMKKGWMGDVSAGYGTHERWADRVNLNRFKDDFRVSIIGNLNNTGGRTGSGGGRGGVNGDNLNGDAGGNIVFAVKNFELGGNARYRYGRTKTWSRSASQNFVSTRGSFSNRLNSGMSHNKQFSSDFKLEWKPDSMTNIIFRPNVNVGNNDNTNESQSLTFNADPYADSRVKDPLAQKDLIDNSIKINDNASDSRSDSENWSVSGNLTMNRRILGRPWFGESNPTNFNGRNISFRMNASASESESRNFNHSNVTYHQRGDSTDLTYRYRNTPSWNRNWTAGVTWSEPIMRVLFLQANYSYNYSKRHSEGQTFDFAKVDEIGQQLWEDYGKYGLLAPNYFEFLSDSLSRYTDNVNKTHNLELQLRLTSGIFNISSGVRIERQTQEMQYAYQGLDTLASRTFSRFSPTLNARLRFTRQHTMQFTYRGQTNQPDMTDLFNLTDNSNPLNIREGNPDLKPSYNNNFGLSYNNFFETTRRSIGANLNYSNTINSTANRTIYNEETGGQITKPVNTNGNWNASASLNFNTPFIWDKLMLNTSTSGTYDNRVSFLYQNRETVENNVKSYNLREQLTLTLRMGDYDIRANGNIIWNKSTSAVVAATNQSTYNFRYELSSTGNFENGFGYTTNIGVNSRRGYSSKEMNTNELLWNAQVSYRFLQRRATVTLAAYDILQQRSNISRQMTAYSRTDSENNSIFSYYMLTFQYRLRQFGTRQGRAELRQQRAERDAYDQRMQSGGGRPEGGGQGGQGGRGGEGGGPGGNRGGGFGGGRM